MTVYASAAMCEYVAYHIAPLHETIEADVQHPVCPRIVAAFNCSPSQSIIRSVRKQPRAIHDVW